MKFGFVILHYITIEDTINCIESIYGYLDVNKFEIIVVDNGSPNESGDYLKKRYSTDDKIHVILSNENLGFAKGNNIGYQYAKKLKCDYIICLNSDTLITDRDFLDKIDNIFRNERFSLLGPDIINVNNEHQNPFREKGLNIKDVKKKIIIKSIFLFYYNFKKIFRLENKINILERAFDKKTKNQRGKVAYDEPKFDVVLQGACIIYSKDYILNEDYAFLPDTFMYGEEDLLYYYSKQKKYKMLYYPGLKIKHLDGKSTNNSIKKENDRNIFYTKHSLRGFKLLLHHMKGE